MLKRTGRANNSTWEDRNKDTIKITTGPVLVANKKVVAHTPAKFNGTGYDKGTITYAITIKNNGAALTEPAKIYDYLPDLLTVNVKENGSIEAPTRIGEDSRITNVQLVKSDSVEAQLPERDNTITPPTITNDGYAVVATIPKLESRGTTTLTFVTEYEYTGSNFVGGENVYNKAYIHYTNSGSTIVETNTTTTKLPSFYGLEAFGRDNKGEDKTDTVNSAPAGSEVIFKTKIDNKANGNDAFTLAIAPNGNTFPEGTTFTFWEQNGAIQLINKSNPQYS